MQTKADYRVPKLVWRYESGILERARGIALFNSLCTWESGRFKIHAIRIMVVTVKVNGMGRSTDKIEMFCEANWTNERQIDTVCTKRKSSEEPQKSKGNCVKCILLKWTICQSYDNDLWSSGQTWILAKIITIFTAMYDHNVSTLVSLGW